MPNNFDLSNFALQSICPNNEILYDDKGLPSIMVKIPKMTLSQLGVGTSTEIHPAFIVNGQEIDAIYISKYQNVVFENRGYSLPNKTPENLTNFNNVINYCSNKNANGKKGWHLMTRAEWALIALWCRKNEFVPSGNNRYGKDLFDTVYQAFPATSNNGNINIVKTGTGPLTWSHNNSPSGIFDLNGNIDEWNGGLRIVGGEIQVIANNSAADSSISQASDSVEWKAIHAETGEYLTPDGNGTTQNSIKIDIVSNALVYSTNIITRATSSKSTKIRNLTTDSTVNNTAIEKLQALALYPIDNSSTYYRDNSIGVVTTANAERLFYCGGRYTSNTYDTISQIAGIFNLYSNTRSGSSQGKHSNVGFRACYCDIPAPVQE